MEVIVARNAPRHHHGDPTGNFVVVRPRRPGYRRLSKARSGRLPLPIVRLNDDVDAGPTTTSFARSQGSFRPERRSCSFFDHRNAVPVLFGIGLQLQNSGFT